MPQIAKRPVRGEASALHQRLALSADQQAKLRAILRDRKAQMLAIRGDASLTPHARREKTRDARALADGQIRSMLNENQLAEYDQILRERAETSARKRQTSMPAPQ
jgi:hypothetical protein